MKKSIPRCFGLLAMGGECKRAPFSIDIGQAMKHAAGELYGLEITGKQTNSCLFDQDLEQGGENDITKFTDDHLKERIQANLNLLKSNGVRPKDNGEKVRKKLAQLCEEQDKRLQKSKTGNRENGQEKSKSSAFSEDLKALQGMRSNFNIDTESVGKSNSSYKLSRETCHDQKCNSSGTVSVSSFYSRSGDLSFGPKKHHRNCKSSNEALKSIPARVASGKRNRATSPYTYDQKDKNSLLGCSHLVSKRRMTKATSQESVSNHNRKLLPGMLGCKDFLGASLDTAMELSDDEERKVLDDSKANFQQGKEVIAHNLVLRSNSARNEGFRVTYPSGDPEAVEVQQADLKHLNAYEFLNDTIIDFYIMYLQRPEFLSKEKKTVFHFFNTFFYKKLLLEKRKKKRFELYHSKLRKWTKGINIFEKKYLLVPVHNCAHWSLAIICFAMDYQEKEVLTPYILHLDSMKEGHVSEEVFKVLTSYLEAEWNHVKGLDGVADGCTIVLKSACCKRVEVPLQQNAWDCGLFLLYFMECFLRDAKCKFEPCLLDSMFGRHWFKPQEASNLRTRIKCLLQNLGEVVNTEILMEDMD